MRSQEQRPALLLTSHHNTFVTFQPPQGAAYLIGDFTDWDERPMPIAAPITLEFPAGAYVEYAFLDVDKSPMADPTNQQKPTNPWYDYHRALTLPGNSFIEPQRRAVPHKRSTLQQISSRVFAEQRHYIIYEPPSAPLATLYVQDGESFFRKLRLHEVAEALIERHLVRPVRLVFIEPVDRTREYCFNERYEAFLLEELLPAIELHYGVTEERGLWGASLGGLVSVWLAWRHPQLFAKVASQSGCFTALPGGNDYYHDPEWLTEQMRQLSHHAQRFYIDTGQLEWLLAPNRRFAALLADKGYVHSYTERPGGHNWATWEQGLAAGLRYLFPQTN